MQNNSVTWHEDDAQSVTALLTAHLTARVEQANLISPQYGQLWQEITRLAHSGGKHIRPRLALLAYRICDGLEPSKIVPAAAAIELLHLSMLIHDDIIDRDYVRYGVDNVAGAYVGIYAPFFSEESDKFHYAHSAAILAGNLLLSEAYRLLSTAEIDAGLVLQVHELFGQSIFEVIGGELLDTEAAFRDDATATPEKIALYKTASYSFILPLLVGATFANASEDEIKILRSVGHNLGIAYQMKDDLIGVFGKPEISGKTTIGDLREGKQTYLVEQFYELADASQRHAFNRHFGAADLTESQADELRELIKQSGALRKTDATVEEYLTKAQQAYSGLTIDNKYQDQFQALIASLSGRTH